MPAYYGGWLKRAESLLALGRRDEARACAEKAARLNPYDFRIRNIRKLLK
ncbi:MAG TPA: tetratricopeptide repeat protein [Spirochaetota bacterium]|nr:tetratricopeptide repeat protein [Spirochaetota bacterium]